MNTPWGCLSDPANPSDAPAQDHPQTSLQKADALSLATAQATFSFQAAFNLKLKW